MSSMPEQEAQPTKKQRMGPSVVIRSLVASEPFKQWMKDVLVCRGFDEDEAAATADWAARTASYEVETHGARKLLSLLDHEFARSGSCIPRAKHTVLLSMPSMEVWDGQRKLVRTGFQP